MKIRKLIIPLIIILILSVFYKVRTNDQLARGIPFIETGPMVSPNEDIKKQHAPRKAKSTTKTHKQDSVDQRLLMSLSEDNSQQILKALKDGANPNLIFNKRKFTFAMDQSLNCNPPILKALIKAGADLSMKDGHGKTALDYAYQNGNEECIRLIKELN